MYAHCVRTLYIVLHYISCYVCQLCAYLVHCFILHFRLCMPIVCVLSTLVHITFHAIYAHCVHT
ncbi:hypothetical protein HanIR_Chr02g0091901 [Helianthus annuus]|nr:hypothetical protein HanIR_Chr02g0091901 [Helianthus annuus]